MADSAYNTLTDKVASISKDIETKKKALSTLQNDATYIFDKTALQQVNVAANNSGGRHKKKGGGLEGYDWNTSWVTSGGVVWNDDPGGSTAAANAAGRSYINQTEEKIRTVQGEITDLEKQLVVASKAVTDYQKESPTVKGEIAASIETVKGLDSRKKLIAIGIFLFIIGVTIAIIIKNKKPNTATT